MSVWDTLSRIDCSKHIEKKGKFDYLSWTWAWAMVKENYPEATYSLLDDNWFPDQTVEVRVRVTIGDLSHDMWLPVLDFKNNSIQSPSAFDINTARMRCLVKCLAMFGLGHYVYAGESFPQAPSYTEKQREEFLSYLASGDSIGLRAFVLEVGNEVMDALFNSAPQGQKTRFKQEVRDLYGASNTLIKNAVAAIQEAIEAKDYSAIEEIYSEMDGREAVFIEAALTDIEKRQITDMKEAA